MPLGQAANLDHVEPYGSLSDWRHVLVLLQPTIQQKTMKTTGTFDMGPCT